MGFAKWTLVAAIVVVAVVCMQNVYGVPNPAPLALRDRQELAQRFAEFLQDDKEIAGALEKLNRGEEHLVRARRQSKNEPLDDDDYQPSKEPGFFDKAAKFVTELLQRFLKWINSNDNK